MKKLILIILILFALGALALYGISRTNPNLFAEIKILAILLNTALFAIALVIIAIKEKDAVRFPFLTAVVLALFSGRINGAIIFKNRYYIIATAVLFIVFVVYLQIKHRRFSNKIYKTEE